MAVHFSNRWLVVVLLSILYATSFTDRQVLALLVEPVSHDLHISRLEMGFLLGPGFALLYAFMALPIAALLDRGARIRLVFWGVVLWSTATIASAFAQTFTQMLVARSGIAIGEAVLSPAAISLIGDLFTPAKRPLPTTIYTSMSAIMPTGALVVGGAALALSTASQQLVPWSPWRGTLILIGIPGLILAALLRSFGSEPARQSLAPTESSFSSQVEVVRYVTSNWRFYIPFFLALASVCIVQAGAQSWIPTLLIRRFDISAVKAGLIFGTTGALAGLLGALMWPIVVLQLQIRGRIRDLIWLLVSSAAAITVSASALQFLPGLGWAYPCLFLLIFGVSGVAVLPPVVLQVVAPSGLRARMIALMLLSMNVGGIAIGPILIAALSNAVHQDNNALAVAIGWDAILFGPAALVLWVWANSTFSKLVVGRRLTEAPGI